MQHISAPPCYPLVLNVTRGTYNRKRRHVRNATYTCFHLPVLWLTEGDVRGKRTSEDSWFYWSQGSHKHFLYLCRYKKLEFTWQLRGYRIVWRVIQSNFWIYSGHKKMQLAMCIQCLDILNIKGLEAEAQSRKKQKSVRSGRRQFSSEIWVQKLQQPLINVFVSSFSILGLVFTRSKCNVETKQCDSKSFHSAKCQMETSSATHTKEINSAEVRF